MIAQQRSTLAAAAQQYSRTAAPLHSSTAVQQHGCTAVQQYHKLYGGKPPLDGATQTRNIAQ